ncbi:MAG TPA: ATP-binding protein [Longimicrobium sp.]
MTHPTCADLLRQLNELDEHPRVEAKTSSQAGKSTLQTVCALSNEPGLGGGYLLLGVERTPDLFDREYRAVGIADPDKVQADLASQCASMFNRIVRPEMWSEVVDGEVLVGVFVPEVPAGDKPIHFSAQGLPRGAYRRIGSSDQKCTEDDLLVFYHGRQHQTYDLTPIPDVELTDLDTDAIAEYRRERARANASAEELRWSDAELLRGLGCLVRHESRMVATVAGVLLFGTRATLRRTFPMMRLDYIRVPGREWITDPETRFETLDMRDPLMRLIRRGEAAIMDDMPKQFRLPEGELQRRDLPRIPDRVVREAVVNALMHRTYRTHGATQIIRYSNRVEIRNPGHSLKPEDQLGEPGSQTRNPAIAAILHETLFAETKGSGVRVMRELMRQTNLAPPTFESDRERDQFTATLFFHHLLSETDLAWLSNFSDSNLSTDEAKALVHLREAGRISNAIYRELTGVDTLEASMRLRRLRQLGFLRQHDRGSATYYTATDRLLNPSRRASVTRIADAADAREFSAAESGEFEIKSGEFVTQSGELSFESGEFGNQSEELSPELRAVIRTLKRRTPQPELRALIYRICSERPFGSESLARLLQREQAYVVEKYLAQMIRDGELEYTIPGKPNDPRQAYRAPAKSSGGTEVSG